MIDSTKALEGISEPLHLIKKTIQYYCGCEVVLPFHGPKDHSLLCLKCKSSIQRIVTEELFIESE